MDAGRPGPVPRMNAFDTELACRLAALREQGLSRALRRVDSPQAPRIESEGRTLLNFSSNDYLGLANEPALKEAAIKAVERFGAGAGGSRLICGSLAPHHELEEALAAFKGTAALSAFPPAMPQPSEPFARWSGQDDVVVLDKLVHACIVDAARLCGAKLRVFGHNDRRTSNASCSGLAARAPRPRTLIVTREHVLDGWRPRALAAKS